MGLQTSFLRVSRVGPHPGHASRQSTEPAPSESQEANAPEPFNIPAPPPLSTAQGLRRTKKCHAGKWYQGEMTGPFFIMRSLPNQPFCIECIKILRRTEPVAPLNEYCDTMETAERYLATQSCWDDQTYLIEETHASVCVPIQSWRTKESSSNGTYESTRPGILSQAQTPTLTRGVTVIRDSLEITRIRHGNRKPGTGLAPRLSRSPRMRRLGCGPIRLPKWDSCNSTISLAMSS